jgi:dTDP-4-amino-4,6-dideoxygalactose transaminase
MIQLNNIKEYNLLFEEEYVQDLKGILASGQYILGEKVEQFENSICKYIGVNKCLGVSSGTSALEIVFDCLDLDETDEIIIQANAYIACALGVIKSNATLKIIDCEKNGVFSIDDFVSNVTERTKAVLVVHLYGDCCNMERMTQLCEDRKIKLIEDCAQSFGSTYNGKKLGSFGYASCHSFYPTKNLGALGDAGAICTNDSTFYDKIKQYRNLGSIEKYKHVRKGTNSRLDALQACFLLRKLTDVDRSIARKQAIAAYYMKSIPYVHVKNNNNRVDSSYHLFVIRVNNRQEFMQFMKQCGIETIIHYPEPFYKSSAFSELNVLTFENCEELASQIVSIPIYPTLTDDQVQNIVLKVCEFNKQDETHHNRI